MVLTIVAVALLLGGALYFQRLNHRNVVRRQLEAACVNDARCRSTLQVHFDSCYHSHSGALPVVGKSFDSDGLLQCLANPATVAE